MLLLVSACTAHGYDMPVGPLLVSNRAGEIVMKKGQQEWTISLAKLPVRRVDCADPCGTLGGCYEPCIWGGYVFAFDEQRQNVYFAVPTGISQNRPWIMFRYGLRTKTITRLTNEYGGGFRIAGAVSPSGRYLAYVFGPHIAAVCAPQSYVGVVDMQERRFARAGTLRAATAEAIEVTEVKWSSPSVIEYEADVVSSELCGTPSPSTQRKGIVNLEALKFE